MLQVFLFEVRALLLAVFRTSEAPPEGEIVAEQTDRMRIDKHGERLATDLVRGEHAVDFVGVHPYPELLAEEQPVHRQELPQSDVERNQFLLELPHALPGIVELLLPREPCIGGACTSQCSVQ